MSRTQDDDGHTRGARIRAAIRRHRILSALALVCVLIGAGLLIRWGLTPPPKPPAPPVVPVSVASASVQDVPVSITALGTAQAWRSDMILAQVSGVLLRVAFREGSNVQAGQLLAEIDPAPYRAALTQAQGALERDRALLAGARVDLARYQTLMDKDSIARQTFDDQSALVKQDEGTVEVDEGNVAAAEVNLRWCRITAPIAGRVGVRMIDPGNYVTASAARSTTTGTAGSTTSPVGIVIVNEIEPIAVTFWIPQGDYQRLSEVSNRFRKPLATQAISQDTGIPLATGELTIADNRVDPATGTVEMKARFANTDDRLLPGQFVNIKLTLQTLANAVTVPAAAVNQGPDGSFAYVVAANQTVSMRPIKPGDTEGATTVVTSGLSAGEVVVTDGQNALGAGSTVRISAPASGSASGSAPAPAPAPAPPPAPAPGRPAS